MVIYYGKISIIVDLAKMMNDECGNYKGPTNVYLQRIWHGRRNEDFAPAEKGRSGNDVAAKKGPSFDVAKTWQRGRDKASTWHGHGSGAGTKP